MVAGIKAEINRSIMQEPFDLCFSLHMAVHMRVEQAGKAVLCAAVSAPLDVVTVGRPFRIGQLRIHLEDTGFQIGVHRRQQDNVFCGREVTEQCRNIVDLLQHLLHRAFVQKVAALGCADQRQAACIHCVFQHLRVVVRHIAPRADLAALIARNFHLIQAAPPLGLLSVLREPDAPGIGCNANLDCHIIFPPHLTSTHSCFAADSSTAATVRSIL